MCSQYRATFQIFINLLTSLFQTILICFYQITEFISGRRFLIYTFDTKISTSEISSTESEYSLSDYNSSTESDNESSTSSVSTIEKKEKRRSVETLEDTDKGSIDKSVDIFDPNIGPNISVLKSIEAAKDVEPLLMENPDRFVILPIEYHDMWKLYKQAVASFWTVEEVILSKVCFKFCFKFSIFIAMCLTFFFSTYRISWIGKLSWTIRRDTLSKLSSPFLPYQTA